MQGGKTYQLLTALIQFGKAPRFSPHMIGVTSVRSVWCLCVCIFLCAKAGYCPICTIFSRGLSASLSSQCCLAEALLIEHQETAASYHLEPTGVLVRRIHDVNAELHLLTRPADPQTVVTPPGTRHGIANSKVVSVASKATRMQCKHANHSRNGHSLKLVWWSAYGARCVTKSKMHF